MRRENKTKEDAVSPVIGVMLMLVVTVVIAAVIVGFSTDLAGNTEKTPAALFEVEYIQMSDMGQYDDAKKNALANFGIIHKGGDAIPLKDIRITLEPKGGESDGIIQTIKATNKYEEFGFNPTMEECNNGPYTGHTFPLMVLGKGSAEDVITGVNVEIGDVLRVVYWDGRTGTGILKSGTIVKWTLSHTPTTSIIAKGEFLIP